MNCHPPFCCCFEMDTHMAGAAGEVGGRVLTPCTGFCAYEFVLARGRVPPSSESNKQTQTAAPVITPLAPWQEATRIFRKGDLCR
jgi:hypothetical protein